jgi:hypothetical protein
MTMYGLCVQDRGAGDLIWFTVDKSLALAAAGFVSPREWLYHFRSGVGPWAAQR